MSTVAERPLDITSLQTAWQGLNKLVPLGAITSARDYKRRVQVMDELLNLIGANDSHRLMPYSTCSPRKSKPGRRNTISYPMLRLL